MPRRLRLKDLIEGVVLCMWRSSWTGTDDGQQRAVFRASKVIAVASRPCAMLFVPRANSVFAI
jgi:hypothetical protein